MTLCLWSELRLHAIGSLVKAIESRKNTGADQSRDTKLHEALD
jgi:hypothetical protein